MRPARDQDLPELLRLWQAEVAIGRQDIVPSETRVRRMLGRFEWDTRSRVIERGGGLAGSVLVMSRPSPDGVIANVYAAGLDGSYLEMVRWGVSFCKAAGANVVQVFTGKGHGQGFEQAGLRRVRPWWRMDRGVDGALPVPNSVPGYVLVDAAGWRPDSWAELFNDSFADHWRFAPRGEQEIVADRSPELCLAALGATDRKPVALALGELETYVGDGRPQPVGLISSVGTLPAHRRKGLATWLVAEILRRLESAGARHLSLYVDGGNRTRAFDVYRKLGFEVTFEAEVWEATVP